ncbi:putative methyltransferase-domain-containing protein [Podospora appendiculata]|uniref:Methyltransferase-domain-containing protein n=1 Tax=Podospora appendiculata TaxID=314037 RepID=A0AAE1C836_9PEZI|nr:putative methyltransferase-domain-containing protein [Podospora appendiculata]
MHYIRLLRPSVVEQSRLGFLLKVVLTITTDLSDSFLSPTEPVELAVIGVSHAKDGEKPPPPFILKPTRVAKWQTGMRVLKLDIPLDSRNQINTILIRPVNRQLAALGTTDIYPGSAGQGLILPVYEDILTGDSRHVCFRSLRLPGGDGTITSALQVEEEMGESMARHVWDGGLTATCLVADMCSGSPSQGGGEKPLPSLNAIFQQDKPLNVIELGCGVGILGIGFARILGASSLPNLKKSHVLLTDLPEAEERAQANIARCDAQAGSSNEALLCLDYENLDWDDGKFGNFGPKVQSRPWDLIVLSDCTYNDMLPCLVQTLSALHIHSARQTSDNGPESRCNTKILLATKQRHSAEKAVFDLMAADGWLRCEEAVVPLPVLDGKDESVDVYLFAKN